MGCHRLEDALQKLPQTQTCRSCEVLRLLGEVHSKSKYMLPLSAGGDSVRRVSKSKSQKLTRT